MMMLGLLAASQRVTGGSVLPGSALATARFVDGVYEVGGVPVLASDIIANPEFITANGLEIPDTVDGGPVPIIGDFLAVLNTMDWTMRFKYRELTDDNLTMLFVMINGEESTEGLTLVRQPAENDLAISLDDFNDTISREARDATGFGSGVHRIALTSVAGRLSISVDGGAVISDATVATIAGQPASFGGPQLFGGDFSGNACHIIDCIVWAPMDDVDLPALSAIA